MAASFSAHQLLPEVYLLNYPRFSDDRGFLEKYYNSEYFSSLGFNFLPKECFLSESRVGALRGMHYQTGKSAHEKLVTCIRGRVLDVVVDIRPESPFFNRPVSFELTDKKQVSIFVGKGYAHGFLALEDNCLLLYHTSTVYSPSFDAGVLWSSIDFSWPNTNPILSNRDRFHKSISDLI